jgi:hypothetical protein
MSNLALSVAIVFALAVAAFAVMRSIGVEQGALASVAGLLTGTIVWIHQFLEKKEFNPSPAAIPRGIVTFEKYTLPWYVMLVYGTLMTYAVTNIAAVVIWALKMISGLNLTDIIPTTALLIAGTNLYFIGHWIGSRCDRLLLVTTLGIVISYSIATVIIPSGLRSSSDPLDVTVLRSRLLVWLPIALLGLLRGYRGRLLGYLGYLLAFLPKNARPTAAGLLYKTIEGLSADQFRAVAQGSEDASTPPIHEPY